MGKVNILCGGFARRRCAIAVAGPFTGFARLACREVRIVAPGQRFTAAARAGITAAVAPHFIEPCLPSPGEKPPTGPDWVHEIKHDGYRLMARRGPVGIRFERLREPRRPSTCSMVKTCGASRLSRKAATFARVRRPRLQIGRFRRCSLPALQQ
jgi:hypothetical protein